MTDPRIDIILEHLNLVCKFYKEDDCGLWCGRAYGKKGSNKIIPKYVHCEGQLRKCELIEDDLIIKT